MRLGIMRLVWETESVWARLVLCVTQKLNVFWDPWMRLGICAVGVDRASGTSRGIGYDWRSTGVGRKTTSSIE